VTEVLLHPYLQFHDRARDAMAFYRDVFGGELTTQTFVEGGMRGHPSNDGRLMHAQLVTPQGLVLMASDVPDEVPYQPGSAVSISLSGDAEPMLRGFYDALAAGGTVLEPLAPAPWGDHFGACIDRFGTSWMVNMGSSPACTPPAACRPGPAGSTLRRRRKLGPTAPEATVARTGPADPLGGRDAHPSRETSEHLLPGMLEGLGPPDGALGVDA
jgi:PhnB protein